MATDPISLDDITIADEGRPVASSTAPGAKEPDATEAEKSAVSEWTKKIKDAKKHHKPVFDRMKECQQVAKEGRAKEWPEDSYTVPVLKRHTNVAVAALYARNPTAVAKRKKKVQFTLWDGNFATLQQAMQTAMPRPPSPPTPENPAGDPGSPGDPNAAALLQEVSQVHQQNVQMDRAARTLEILFNYFMNEQDAGYKQQLKAAVRRTKVCAVSWISLGFQRVMQPNPDVTAKIADVTSQITRLKTLTHDLAEGEFDDTSAKMDELTRLMADLQSQPELIVREGPVLGFPKANQVIVDTNCVHLKTLAGANWAAQELPPMTRDAIQETFNVDIGSSFQTYASDKKEVEGKNGEQLAVVWLVQDKKNQQTFAICDGYPAYLKPPAAPDVKISRFWTLFPLVFNEVEDDDKIYSDSDVWDARHMQREYNTVRQGLREHRIQNKPKYGVQAGLLSENDKIKLASGVSGSVLELGAIQTGQKIADILQAIPTVPIDPNLYEVSSIFADIERVIGSSQADLGAASSQTATASSIVEQGRSTMNSDNVDDLDDVLTEVARSMGELMLLELDRETAIKIAGPGAVWPMTTPSRQQIADDLWLEIKAGSSGRPNRASELANMERGLPYLIQLPGVNPYPLGRRYGDLLDLDVEDIVIEGMPSIQAQNSMAGKDPFGAGAAGMGQGAAGGMNAPGTAPNEPGPQPAYTAPSDGMQAQGTIGTASSPMPAPRYQAQKIPIGPGA